MMQILNSIRKQRCLPHLSYNDVLQKKLEVMDNTAITLCMNNKIPIMVFNIDVPGNIVKACEGENLGTLIEEK